MVFLSLSSFLSLAAAEIYSLLALLFFSQTLVKWSLSFRNKKYSGVGEMAQRLAMLTEDLSLTPSIHISLMPVTAVQRV